LICVGSTTPVIRPGIFQVEPHGDGAGKRCIITGLRAV
jgi:hypothetical protein